MEAAQLSETVSPQTAVAPRPDNVPEDRVIDFNLHRQVADGKSPQQLWRELRDQATHSVVWTPRNGGHWIVLEPELCEVVLSESEIFSTRVVIVPREPVGEIYSKYLPLSLDPPEHGAFRKILNDNLGSKPITRMKPAVRDLTIELIEGFKPNGRCNFTHDFAEQLPVRIFMRVVDLPEKDLPLLKYLSDQFTRPDGTITLDEVEKQFSDYIGPAIRSRRGKPADDLISQMVNGQIRGRHLTDEEAENMCIQVLIAGLDTVVNLLGFIFSYLATEDTLRRKLASNPALQEDAILEFLRRFPLVSGSREVRREYEFGGVILKPRDMIMASTIPIAMSESSNPNALEFQLERPARHHYIFGKGPHVCPGAPLARLELKIILEEWLSRIPEFRLSAGKTLSYASGIVAAVNSFELEWDV